MMRISFAITATAASSPLRGPGPTGLQTQSLSRPTLPWAPLRPRAPSGRAANRLARSRIYWLGPCFGWIGHRRLCSTLVESPPIRGELLDSTPSLCPRTRSLTTSAATRPCLRHGSKISAPSAGITVGSSRIVLSIDGPQPEKGHETLLRRPRVAGEEGMVCRGVDLGVSRRGPRC